MMIEISDLRMQLGSGGRTVTILEGITLQIPQKQFVAVVGPSGSGKSTLLGLIAGLDRPTAGSIRIDGVSLSDLNEDALARLRREKIGMIFQSFHLIPTLTALENVQVPLELRGDPHPESEAHHLLEAVGLGDRKSHYPVQLSGGEQQRVAVARAYAARPALLLADEPTGNLDSANGARVIDLLFQLHRDRGSTLILVTHDPLLAARAERIVSLRDGQVVGDIFPDHRNL
ncbi:MAG: ABC transporter ATP-binding protein [Candidatus Manganitrophaceae bacterium]